MTVENVLGRLERVKKTGDGGWTAGCPAHDDRHASLSVGVGDDGRTLLRCFAGCDTAAVVAAVGLEMRDLFDAEPAALSSTKPKAFAGGDVDGLHAALLGNRTALARLEELRGWTWPALVNAGVGIDRDRVTFPYRNGEGALVGVARYAPNPATRNGGPKTKADAGSRRELFPSPERMPTGDRWLFLTEGEPDALRAFSCGLPAVSVPGVNGWRSEWAERFHGRRVCVVFDCDRPGRDAAQRVATDVAEHAAEVRILDLDTTREDGYDLTDFLAVAVTVEERNQARELLEKCADAAPKVLSAPKESSVRKEFADGGTGFPFAPLSSALVDVAETLEWTWRDYLAPGVVTLVAGRPKAGKSTLVCGLVAAIAAGRPFLDRDTRTAGVLVLSEERPGTLREKADRFGLDDRVHLLMSHQVNGAAWEDVVIAAVAHCKTAALGVLVVDTLHQWTKLAGDAENAAGAVLTALEPLQQAAAAGLAVVIVVHQRKSSGEFGEAVRGSNALVGGVDIVVELERPRGSELLATDGVRVLRSVSRFAGTPDELVLALTDDGYEYLGTTAAASAIAELDQLLAVLEDGDGATAAELSEATGIPESTVRKRLNSQIEAGTVEKTGRGGKVDPFRFVSAQLIPLRAEQNPSLLDGGAS